MEFVRNPSDKIQRSRPLWMPLVGGLGNQLFQLSYGIRLANLTARPVKFATLGLERWSSVDAQNKFAIEYLLSEAEHLRVGYPALKLLSISRRLFPNLWITAADDSDCLDRLPKSSTLLCSGYFQSVANAEYAWLGLLERVRASIHLWSCCDGETLPQISVHVRLGDYRVDSKTRKIYGLLPLEYFLHGIKSAEFETGLRRVHVISNEPDLAQELIESRVPKNFEVSFSRNSTDLEDFSVLSRSAAIVASNSTFSWWGSYFASRLRSARVYMPFPWYLDREIDNSSFYDPSWSLVNRTFD